MIYLFLATGFEVCEALLVKDLLTRANLNIKTVSLTDTLEVTSSHGVTVKADILFNEVNANEASMLVLPGGLPGTRNLQNSDKLRKLFSEVNKDTYLAAICAAPLVLADFGYLHNKPATIYPGMESELGDAIYTKEKVVKSENIITGCGLGAGIDFSLALIEALTDKETALKVKNQIVY